VPAYALLLLLSTSLIGPKDFIDWSKHSITLFERSPLLYGNLLIGLGSPFLLLWLVIRSLIFLVTSATFFAFSHTFSRAMIKPPDWLVDWLAIQSQFCSVWAGSHIFAASVWSRNRGGRDQRFELINFDFDQKQNTPTTKTF